MPIDNFSVHQAASSIDQLNNNALATMILLAQAASGGIDPSDPRISYVNAKGELSTGKTGDTVQIMGVNIGKVTGRNSDGRPQIDILAGGLVELQFKVDSMLAVIQELIKNTNKVSQPREAAARA